MESDPLLGFRPLPASGRFEMNGCYLDAEEDTCNAALQTVLTDQPVGWRHVALDTALGILYFCDLNPKRKEVLCYSSGDGASWTGERVARVRPDGGVGNASHMPLG